MFGGGICTPALIYLIFSISQIVIDTVKGFFNTALIKLIVTIIFTLMLNYLCSSGLGILSWIIVFIPFILMTVVVTMLLFVFNLDPKTGNLIRANDSKNKIDRDLILYHEHGDEGSCKKEQGSDKNPLYKIKLDDDASRGATNMDRAVSIPPIRDQRLAKYV